jgi:hypothetical protein
MLVVPEPLSEDMKDLLNALNRLQAQYLIIGAHAVGVYAEPRGTKDLDVWINPTRENARRVHAALREFGAPLYGVSEETLTNKQHFLVIGVAPNRIDILKSIPGPGFRACWKHRRTFDIHGTTANFLSLEDLLSAKLAAGRPQDLVDAAKLEEALEVEREKQAHSDPNADGGEQNSSPSPRRQKPRRRERDGGENRGPRSKR